MGLTPRLVQQWEGGLSVHPYSGNVTSIILPAPELEAAQT
jgi:hypothetical protein